jgi:hypothetical protein
MAGIPLNTFRTVTKTVQYLDPANTTPTGLPGTQNIWAIYSAPPGTTGIILYCQIANVSTVPHTASMWHYRPGTGTFTAVVWNISIPNNDARVMLDGKLVLETNDILFASCSAQDLSCKLIASVLESANQ